MSENSSPPIGVIGIADAFLKSCSISRHARLPGPSVTQTLAVECHPNDSPVTDITITLSATASAGEGPEPGPAEVEASAAVMLVLAEPVDEFTDALVVGAMQFAWPYLRSAIDSVTGVARVPVFAVPLAPPVPAAAMRQENHDGTE